MTTSQPQQVTVLQSDLDGFAQAINSVATDVSAAVAVLGPYIQQLLTGQPVQLNAGDESGVRQALTVLETADTSLKGLEPPAPATPPASS